MTGDYVAETVAGLEWVCAEEVAERAVGYVEVEPGRVRFSAPHATMASPLMTASRAERLGGGDDPAEFSPLDHGHITPALAGVLLRLASLDPGALVADPFCGRGVIAVTAARAGARVIASDLDAERLMLARRNAERAQVAVSLEVADAAAPTWRAGSLDAVIASPPWPPRFAAGGAIPDAFAPVWGEVRRALRPAGVLVVVAESRTGVLDSIQGHLFTDHLRETLRLDDMTVQVAVLSPSDVDPVRPSLRAWRRYVTGRV